MDDDCVQIVNLVGQTLFDERDARTGTPKVLAACRELRRLNPTIIVEPVVTRLTARNVERLTAPADLVLDGADNDATRYLINKACLSQGIPWVFAAVSENYGLTMNIAPGETPCFALIFGRPSSHSDNNDGKKGPARADTAAPTKIVGDKEPGVWASVKNRQPTVFKGNFTDDSLSVYADGTYDLTVRRANQRPAF